jgi:hypothetical protein
MLAAAGEIRRPRRRPRTSRPTWLYENEPAPPSDRGRVVAGRGAAGCALAGRQAVGEPSRGNNAPSEPADDPEAREKRRRRRLIVAAIGGALLLIAAIAFGWSWFTELRWLESTDDAYTQADNTIISPKVAGYVSELPVTDNQVVKAGDLLLRIDPRDYQAAVKQAEADVASGEASIRNVDAQIAAQQSVIGLPFGTDQEPPPGHYYRGRDHVLRWSMRLRSSMSM